MGTQQRWVVTAEILVKPGDLTSGDTNGFTNVVTWADSPTLAQKNVLEALKTYEWEVLGIEAVRRFDDSESYSEEILHSIDQARTNSNACIIGTVFSYKPEQKMETGMRKPSHITCRPPRFRPPDGRIATRRELVIS